MTGLLKRSDLEQMRAVRPFALRQVDPMSNAADRSARETRRVTQGETASEPARPKLEVRDPLAEIQNECDRLTLALRTQREDADEACGKAFDLGKAEGLEQARGDRENHGTLMARTYAGAVGELSDALNGLESLSCQLAETALTAVFGDDEDRRRQVGDAIDRQIKTLSDKLAVTITVSRKDFPDEASAKAIVERYPDLSIKYDGTLAAGGCKIGLTVGTIDLGLPVQWAKLRSLLRDLASEGEAK